MEAVTTRPSTIAGRAGAAVATACALVLLAAPSAYAEEETAATAVAEPTQPAAGPAATVPAAVPGKGIRVLEARARPRTAFYFGMQKISFAIKLSAKAPTDLRIDIVRAKSGVLERTLWQQDVPPNTAVTVPWDGLSGSGTFVQGKLRLVIRATNGQEIPMARNLTAARATKGKGKKKKAKPKLIFGQFDHIFPIRGKHSYGDGLGAGRDHGGQDMPASCGTNVAAAQGGTVQVNSYQDGGAGYYVVIDTVGSDVDHAYLHLLAAPALVPGQVVSTGQLIGQVGNTGRSFGCHLHFEMWSGPGWYEGGAAMDPGPYLRAWDKFS